MRDRFVRLEKLLVEMMDDEVMDHFQSIGMSMLILPVMDLRYTFDIGKTIGFMVSQDEGAEFVKRLQENGYVKEEDHDHD
jgi:hypothetical protein